MKKKTLEKKKSYRHSFFRQKKGNKIIEEYERLLSEDFSFQEQWDKRKEWYLSKYQALSFLGNKSTDTMERILYQMRRLEPESFILLLFRFLFNKYYKKLKCYACGIEKAPTFHVLDCVSGHRVSLRRILGILPWTLLSSP